MQDACELQHSSNSLVPLQPRTLIMVDLPAPLGPSTATRELSDTCTLTSFRMRVSAVGYLKLTARILRMARSLEFTPWRREEGGDGGGGGG